MQEFKSYILGLNSKYKFETLNSHIILKELVPESRDILFIYKELMKSTVVPNVEFDVVKNIAKIEVTETPVDGSPLSAPFSYSDLTLGDEILNSTNHAGQRQVVKYGPVDLQHARCIISKLNLKQLTASLPVYILTNGLDHEKTILIGSDRLTGYVTTYIVNLTDSYMVGNNKEFVDHLIESHTKKSRMTPFELQSLVKSIYQIQGVLGDSSVELHLTWETPTMEVPVSEASTDLHLTCKLNNEVSARLWKDLQRLVRYVHLIKTWKSASNQDVAFERINAVLNPMKTEDLNQDILLTRLASTVEEDKHSSNIAETRWKRTAGRAAASSNTGTTGDVFDVSLAQVTGQVIQGDRSTLDLSDKLWIILSECHTYRDLGSCFQLVFQKIRANIQEGCKVNILGKKCARFVCAVRNLLKGDYSNPEYWDKLELLVEMGVEKLKSDYSFVFLKTNLVDEDQLLPPSDIPKFSEMTGDEWVSHMHNYLNYLARLHTILNILLQVDSCIKLPHAALSNLALAAFEKVDLSYEQIENNECRYPFTCPISTLSIKKFVTGSKLFTSWSLHLFHENEKRRMSTSTLLTMNPLSIHPVYEEKEDADMTLSRLSPFQHYSLRTNCVKFGKLK